MQLQGIYYKVKILIIAFEYVYKVFIRRKIFGRFGLNVRTGQQKWHTISRTTWNSLLAEEMKYLNFQKSYFIGILYNVLFSIFVQDSRKILLNPIA